MYKKILESLDDIIYVTDDNNNVVYSNHPLNEINDLTINRDGLYHSKNNRVYNLKTSEIIHEDNSYKLFHYKENKDLHDTISKHKIDSLTGLPNRMVINEYLNDISILDKSCVIALLDIDHFKKVNDTFGHIYGDAILAEIASLLRMELDKVDFVGRYGGEEFIIVLNSKAVQNSLVDLDNLRKKIEVHFKNHVSSITASIGVSCFHPHDSIMEVISDADKALYYVKENGRNNVGFWDNSEKIKLLKNVENKMR